MLSHLTIIQAQPTDQEFILHLQTENLLQNLSTQEKKQDGFLIWQMEPSYIKYLIDHHYILLAKESDRLAGYLMIDSLDHIKDYPFYQQFYKELRGIVYANKEILMYPSAVVAQICVSKQFRGKGVFSTLYRSAISQWSTTFNLLLGEIHEQNIHSFKSHEKLGFSTVQTYTDKNGVWQIVALNL